MTPETHKVCPHCDTEYPLEHFKAKGGRQSYCAKCWREYSRIKQRKYRERQYNKAASYD